MSPKWIPQFKDNSEVFRRIEKTDSISYPVLVPNIKGFEMAVSVFVCFFSLIIVPGYLYRLYFALMTDGCRS